jgi:hypothetical protein
MIVGNSSAGLIEAAAIPLRSINVGARQAGRERPPNVIDCADDPAALELALRRAAAERLPAFAHPYGDGRSSERVCAILAAIDAASHPITKQNTY